MIGQAIFVIIAGLAFLWFLFTLIDKIRLRKLQGRYKEEDDKGRKSGGTIPTIPGAGGYRNEGESSIQDAFKHAKRELLQGGDGGVPNTNTEPISESKLNHRY